MTYVQCIQQSWREENEKNKQINVCQLHNNHNRKLEEECGRKVDWLVYVVISLSRAVLRKRLVAVLPRSSSIKRKSLILIPMHSELASALDEYHH